MSRRAAILGLGSRGRAWASAFLQAGWEVSVFDPDTDAVCPGSAMKSMRREQTISGTVDRADWVAVCVPERLELLQKVMQRAQAEAPRDAIVGVVSDAFTIDEVQSCALRSSEVLKAEAKPDGGYVFDVSPKTSDDVRDRAKKTLAELAAHASLTDSAVVRLDQRPDAESA